MRILSATDAISPAISRTRDLLFRPFRWGTFLKLCAVAAITERLAGRSNFWKQGGGGGSHLSGSPMLYNISPQMIFFIVLFCIVGLMVGVAILYLVTRLRFALFECLVHQSTEIRPGWHIYREPARRFFWLCLGVGLGYVAFAATVLSPMLVGIFRHLHANPGQRMPMDAILDLVLPLIPVLFLLVVIAIAIDIVLRDFMLPHIALDNATAGEALEAVWNHISAEKGTFFLYAVLRILLPLVALIALAIALILPGVLLFGGGGVMIAMLKAAAIHGSGGVVVVSGMLQAILVIAMAALALFLAVIFGGPLSIALRNYALVFYGGRYPVLGDTMFPPQAGTPPLTA
jgi:hypothetical protein